MRGCAHNSFLYLKKKPFDWPITNIFGTLGTPKHRSLNLFPFHKKKGCFVMLPFGNPFEVCLYTWELNFGQTIGDKTEVLLRTSGGVHLRTLWGLDGNPMRKWKEHIGNKEKKKSKSPSTPHQKTNNPNVLLYKRYGNFPESKVAGDLGLGQDSTRYVNCKYYMDRSSSHLKYLVFVGMITKMSFQTHYKICVKFVWKTWEDYCPKMWNPCGPSSNWDSMRF